MTQYHAFYMYLGVFIAFAQDISRDNMLWMFFGMFIAFMLMSIAIIIVIINKPNGNGDHE